MAKKRRNNLQGEMFNIQELLSTAACVPAIRETIKGWRADGYKGITETTKELINFWFRTDHVMPTGNSFRFHTDRKSVV